MNHTFQTEKGVDYVCHACSKWWSIDDGPTVGALRCPRPDCNTLGDLTPSCAEQFAHVSTSPPDGPPTSTHSPACPTPCRECAQASGRGAYCATTPCPCECHKPESELLTRERLKERLQASGQTAKGVWAKMERLAGEPAPAAHPAEPDDWGSPAPTVEWCAADLRIPGADIGCTRRIGHQGRHKSHFTGRVWEPSATVETMADPVPDTNDLGDRPHNPGAGTLKAESDAKRAEVPRRRGDPGSLAEAARRWLDTRDEIFTAKGNDARPHEMKPLDDAHGAACSWLNLYLYDMLRRALAEKSKPEPAIDQDEEIASLTSQASAASDAIAAKLDESAWPTMQALCVAAAEYIETSGIGTMQKLLDLEEAALAWRKACAAKVAP